MSLTRNGVDQNPPYERVPTPGSPGRMSSISLSTSGVITEIPRKIAIRTLIIFTAINFFNYVDRYTIAGVLTEIQDYYDISDSDTGLIQTVFIIVYMIFCPVFGYLGDRWTRKYLLMFGVLLWSLFVLCASFVPRNLFWLFLLLRAAVGIGEASYVTVAPIVIGDLFPEQDRMLMLSIYSFAIPAGSGFGYILGSGVNSLMSQYTDPDSAWQYSQRVTPIFGVILVILTWYLVPEPPRGASEEGNTAHRSIEVRTSVKEDIIYLFTNRSVVFTTLGFTSVAYTAGSLAFWAPAYLTKAQGTNGDVSDKDQNMISLIFGTITCIAGALGVALGGYLAKYFRPRAPNSDALVAAWGMLVSAPFIYFGLVLVLSSEAILYICMLIGEIALCLNWALVPKILIETVVPNRRSLASGLSTMTGHLFGDAGSPYLVGLIADKSFPENSDYDEYMGLQTGLLTNPIVCVLGAAAFFACAFFYISDKNKCDEAVRAAASDKMTSKRPSSQNHTSQNGSSSGALDDNEFNPFSVRPAQQESNVEQNEINNVR